MLKLTHGSGPAWFRSGSRTCALGLLCIALVGCSGTATKTSVPTQTVPSSTATPLVPPTQRATAPGPSAVGAPSGSACALVTVDEVGAATGQPMAVSGDAGTICTFSASADASLVLYVQIYNDTTSMGLMMQVEPGSDHLTGMGDDAFWNATLGTVFVRRGDRGFSLGLPSLANLSGSPDAIKSSMVKLATAALTRF